MVIHIVQQSPSETFCRRPAPRQCNDSALAYSPRAPLMISTSWRRRVCQNGCRLLPLEATSKPKCDAQRHHLDQVDGVSSVLHQPQVPGRIFRRPRSCYESNPVANAVMINRRRPTASGSSVSSRRYIEQRVTRGDRRLRRHLGFTGPSLKITAPDRPLGGHAAVRTG